MRSEYHVHVTQSKYVETCLRV